MRRYFGAAYLETGRLDDAERKLMEVIETAESVRIVSQIARWKAFLARVHLRAGRADEADRWAADALALARRLGERSNEAWALLVIAEIAAQRQASKAPPTTSAQPAPSRWSSG